MSKPWHKNYPEGVATEISTEHFSSMLEMFHQAVDSYSDNTAYLSFGSSLSYNQVESLSRDFGAYLQQAIGLKKGDRVALMCPNSFPFVIAMWGILRAGGVQVNVNPMYTPFELEHQLNDAMVDTIVVFSGSTGTLAEIIENTSVKNVIVINLDDLVNKGIPSPETDPRLTDIITFTESLKQGKTLEFKEAELTQQDLMYLQYTGGTTGLSKGAMLSHGNILANILQFEAFSEGLIERGEEEVVTAIPMYHIFALAINTLTYFYFGARNVLITNPRDMPSFVETWGQNNPTFFTGVNTLFNGLLHTPGFSDIDFSSLKMSLGGGAPVQDAVSEKWQALTGNRLFEGYGLSETSPVVTMNLGRVGDYVSGIGVPIPSTDVSLRDDEENVVADGESGELCVKGPQVMPGYWNNSEATSECMTADGYFKTGDVAVLDDTGHFHIVDRKKDMILVSGFNVFPNEIEAAVALMDGVLECACIGVEHEKTGEAVKLFVVRSDDNLTAQAVIDFAHEKLSAYKVPKQISFIEELPKSTVGKILRRELRNY
jgi:long-chain acyl-CoA synthetase